MNTVNLPEDLKKIIASEKVDFVVKAKRNFPKVAGTFLIIFGLFYNALVGVAIWAFFGPFFQGKEISFELHGAPVVASFSNLKPLLLPGIFYGLFVAVGIAICARGIVP